MDRFKVVIEYTTGSIEYNNTQIKSITKSNNITTAINNYVTGTISQFGQIELFDINKDIFNKAQNRELIEGLNVKVYYLDTLIANMETEKFNYNWGSSVVTVSLKDTILKWDSIVFNGIEDNESHTAETFFDGLVTASGENVIIDNDTRQYLQNILLPDSFLSFGNLRERFDELLGVLSMVIYKDRQGIIRGILV